MNLTTNPPDTAIELITIRKDEYEAMRQKLELQQASIDVLRFYLEEIYTSDLVASIWQERHY